MHELDVSLLKLKSKESGTSHCTSITAVSSTPFSEWIRVILFNSSASALSPISHCSFICLWFSRAGEMKDIMSFFRICLI
jgi:hypothetical protein